MSGNIHEDESDNVPVAGPSQPYEVDYQQLDALEIIGSKARSALNGDHESLVGKLRIALIEAMHDNPGQTLEISYVDISNFRLEIGGQLHGKLYKF